MGRLSSWQGGGVFLVCTASMNGSRERKEEYIQGAWKGQGGKRLTPYQTHTLQKSVAMNDDPFWKGYIELVDFLGECFGDNVEVVLHDLRDLEHSVIAISNGHITGRSVGAPLTMFAVNKIHNRKDGDTNRIMNYSGTAQNGNPMRSSSFFIRNAMDEIVGMLCINIDISEYQKAEETLRKLCFRDIPQKDEKTSSDALEYFPTSMSVMVGQALHEVLAEENIQVGRLKSAEKIRIVGSLQQKGLFQMKGAVSELAVQLQTSESTIYRYLKQQK